MADEKVKVSVKVQPKVEEVLQAGREIALAEALQAAPTAAEVLARPQVYEAWYKGMRQEALDNG